MSPHFIMFLLIICFGLWGAGMVAMKLAFESFTGPQIILGRVAFAGLFYLILRKKWLPLPYKKGDWLYFLLLAGFEPCLLFACETYSMKYTTAAQGGVIAACLPIFTAIAAWLLLKEKLTFKVISGIVLAVLGVGLSSFFAESDARAPNPLLGNILMLGAVLSSTGYAICARFISRRYSFWSLSAIQALGGTIVFLPCIFLNPFPACITDAALISLLYLGIGLGIIAYLLYNIAFKYLEAGVVTLFGNLIPVFAMFFAWLILNEQFTALQLGGVFLTLTGVIIASTAKKV